MPPSADAARSVPTDTGLGEAVLEAVRAACDASPIEWTAGIDVTEVWVYAEPQGLILPTQGWKLHVSAAVVSAGRVLDAALGVLVDGEYPTAFKVARSVEVLDSLNWGLSGLSQVGKFITVYPTSDAQAVRVAAALHRVTRGERGPRIPSDRPLEPGSLVHYRYGSFVTRYGRLASGEVAPVIEDPSGRAVADRRRVQPPGWAVDPFAGDPADPRPPDRSRVVAERFVLAGTLAQTARGAVCLAVDLDGPRRCVVKHARRDALLLATGTDARDRLRAEATTLEALGPGPWPARLALVDEGEDVFLAEEEVAGQTLWNRLAMGAARGRHLSEAAVAGVGAEVAEALALIHARGLVVSDLKAANVMVSSGDRSMVGSVRLIDLECRRVGSTDVGDALASRGSCSPQQRDGLPASVADDVYGLGALLWFLATNADPAGAPDPTDLGRRPLDRLRPGLSTGLRGAIARCLAPIPEDRFAHAADVAVALRHLEARPAARPAGPTSDRSLPAGRAPRGGPADRTRWATRLTSLASALCRRARPAAMGGVTWRGRSGPPSTDLADGDAGPVLALSAVARAQPDPTVLETLALGALGLHRAPIPEGTRASGLFVGDLGPAVALLAAGSVLGDPTLVDAACDRAERATRHRGSGFDLARGSAGRVRAFGWFEQATGDPRWRGAARMAGDHLLVGAERSDDGTSWWPATETPDRGPATGMLDGVSGMADAVVDLVLATGDEHARHTARHALAWLVAQTVGALDDDRGVTWPMRAGRPDALITWATGATGVAGLLLRARAAGLADGDLDLADRLPAALHSDIDRTLDGLIGAAVTTVAEGTRWLGPSRAHGLAGSIDLLLEADGAALGRPIRPDYDLADLLDAFVATGIEDRPDLGPLSPLTDAPIDLTDGWLDGWSGILATIVRLAHPGTPDLLGPAWYFAAPQP